MNDLERYVLEEHIEDFRDSRIGRRELIRRATFITGSAAAVSTLAALGCNVNTESPAPRAASSVPAAAASATAATSVAQPFATPPAAATTDGITVKPDDPRIQGAGRVTVKANDGAALIGYTARPAGSARAGAIFVTHENRGLLEHIRDVVRRVATAGFVGIAVDLLSRDGGADKLTDAGAYSAALAKRSIDDMLADVRAALDFVNGQPYVQKDVLGMTGFCFGGGPTWSTIISGLPLKVGVPFYGPLPAQSDGLAKTKTAVFAVYAELDARITASAPQVESLLKQSGAPYKITVYPGVNHAFHNDTNGPDRYNAPQAQKAWVDAIEWFRTYLR